MKITVLALVFIIAFSSSDSSQSYPNSIPGMSMDVKEIFDLIITLCARFNFRATKVYVEDSFYDFLNCFDQRAWYVHLA